MDARDALGCILVYCVRWSIVPPCRQTISLTAKAFDALGLKSKVNFKGLGRKAVKAEKVAVEDAEKTVSKVSKSPEVTESARRRSQVLLK